MHTLTLLTLSLLAFSSFSRAQEPPYLSPVLVKPGLGTQKCMQPKDGKSANGTPVVIATCTGSKAQKWTFSKNLIKVFGNKCLVVPGGKNANGVHLQITTCSSTDPNQKFYYNYFDRNHIWWMGSNRCINLKGGSLAKNTPVEIRDYSETSSSQVWNVGYWAEALPTTSEAEQFGYNNCGTGNSKSSHCQTAWINDVDDFCLWAPSTRGTIGDTERKEVAWCTKSGRGTRIIPNGTLKGVHFVKTKDYVQVTGVGNFSKINVPYNDEGGELDPHGQDGRGNPIGGLVYGDTFGKGVQYHEWTSFISGKEFCFRACVGPNAANQCNHVYDVMGCYWNMPANYDAGVFESCDGDDDLPMGIYDGSTWSQGMPNTPDPHPAAPSSNCHRISTIKSRDFDEQSPLAAPTPAGTTHEPIITQPATTPPSDQAALTTAPTISEATPTGLPLTTPVPTYPASSPTTPTPTGSVLIHPYWSEGPAKCISAASNTTGGDVTIHACNGSPGQTWIRTGSQFKVFDDKCLEVPNGNALSGQKLQIGTCATNEPNQKWSILDSLAIQWNSQKFCVDREGGNVTDGTPLQIWKCPPINLARAWEFESI